MEYCGIRSPYSMIMLALWAKLDDTCSACIISHARQTFRYRYVVAYRSAMEPIVLTLTADDCYNGWRIKSRWSRRLTPEEWSLAQRNGSCNCGSGAPCLSITKTCFPAPHRIDTSSSTTSEIMTHVARLRVIRKYMSSMLRMAKKSNIPLRIQCHI